MKHAWKCRQFGLDKKTHIHTRKSHSIQFKTISTTTTIIIIIRQWVKSHYILTVYFCFYLWFFFLFSLLDPPLVCMFDFYFLTKWLLFTLLLRAFSFQYIYLQESYQNQNKGVWLVYTQKKSGYKLIFFFYFVSMVLVLFCFFLFFLFYSIGI